MLEPASLLEYWNSVVERCGVILSDGTIIEVPNTHAKPSENFSFSKDVFYEHPTATATWHSHPSGSPNLTVPDYYAFKAQPALFHYIVGEKEVWCYYVKDSKVLLYEEDNL